MPTPALLAKVVDLIDCVLMDDRDTKGDLYEYMLGKIATAGGSRRFRAATGRPRRATTGWPATNETGRRRAERQRGRR